MKTLQTKMILLAGLSALAWLPAAQADEWNQKTVFTFSGPVEIPGQVLPAGTYVFKLANVSSNRNIVQIFNKSEDRVFATILAIPDYRMQASDKTIVTFDERPAGSPEAIKGWFYPGRSHGHEFVYPKNEAVALAQANHVPVPFMPTEQTPNTTKHSITIHAPEIVLLQAAPIRAEQPNGTETELAQAFAVDDPNPAATPGLPANLPATATPLPLIGLVGLLSMAAALSLRVVSARVRQLGEKAK